MEEGAGAHRLQLCGMWAPEEEVSSPNGRAGGPFTSVLKEDQKLDAGAVSVLKVGSMRWHPIIQRNRTSLPSTRLCLTSLLTDGETESREAVACGSHTRNR